VGGQLHALPLYPKRNSLRYPLYRFRTDLDVTDKRKVLLLGIEPGSFFVEPLE
jgi:hypothetical protein